MIAGSPSNITPPSLGNARASWRRATSCKRATSTNLLGRCRINPLRACLAGTSSQVRFPSLRRLRGVPAHRATKSRRIGRARGRMESASLTGSMLLKRPDGQLARGGERGLACLAFRTGSGTSPHSKQTALSLCALSATSDSLRGLYPSCSHSLVAVRSQLVLYPQPESVSILTSKM